MASEVNVVADIPPATAVSAVVQAPESVVVVDAAMMVDNPVFTVSCMNDDSINGLMVGMC